MTGLSLMPILARLACATGEDGVLGRPVETSNGTVTGVLTPDCRISCFARARLYGYEVRLVFWNVSLAGPTRNVVAGTAYPNSPDRMMAGRFSASETAWRTFWW